MRFVLMLVLAMLVSACSDGFTVKDEAEMVGGAMCDLTYRCNPQLISDHKCSTYYVESVCHNEDCGQLAAHSEKEVDSCVQALEQLACRGDKLVGCDGILK